MDRVLLLLAAATLTLVACGAPTGQNLDRAASPTAGHGTSEAVRILDASLEDDVRTVRLTLNTCDPEESNVEILEADEESIRLRATARGGASMADCAEGATVELEQPLGNRTLIDATTGEPIETTS